MRRVPTSGGLELGILDSGPWIDIIPVRPGFQPALADANRVALSPMAWEAWRPASMQTQTAGTERIKRTMRGVTTVAPDASLWIRFLWFKDQEPADALYAIEGAESGLPYALAGALLAAASAKRLPLRSAHILAMACTHSGNNTDPNLGGPVSRHLRRAEIDEAVTYLLYPAAGASGVSNPAGAVDRARFWLAASRRLWDLVKPDAFRRSHLATPLERAPDREVAAFVLFARGLTSAWLEMQDQRTVHVAGVALDIPDEARSHAWPQCLVFSEGDISAETLRFLASDHLPTVLLLFERPPGEGLPAVDADLCRGLATAMLREAHDNAAYVPAGQFALALPSDYPLNAWGVASLRVVASPDGLWCAALDAQRQPGAVFHWRPGQPLRSWVVNAAVAPLVEVTLAALWRDLCIAGETAVPLLERQPGASHPAASAPAHSPHPSTRTLPVQRRLSLSGKRTWGSSADHEAIHPRAHGVRGHLRRLHTGWTVGADARQIALEFGLPLPDGYTFVRPHVRGSEAGPQPDTPATVIHARGLQAVMTLL